MFAKADWESELSRNGTIWPGNQGEPKQWTRVCKKLAWGWCSSAFLTTSTFSTASPSHQP